VEGARGGCGYKEVGCGWVGSWGVVSLGERVSNGRSLVCVWAKYLFAPRGVARQIDFPPNLQKQTSNFEEK